MDLTEALNFIASEMKRIAGPNRMASLQINSNNKVALRFGPDRTSLVSIEDFVKDWGSENE